MRRGNHLADLSALTWMRVCGGKDTGTPSRDDVVWTPTSAAAPVRRSSAAGRRPEARLLQSSPYRPRVSCDAECRPPGWCGQPHRARPPSTAQTPGSTSRLPRPERRATERSARPQGLALTGWRRAVGWSRCPVGPHAARGRAEQRCRGRHNAVILGFVTRRIHAQRARRLAQMAQAVEHATRAGCRPSDVLDEHWIPAPGPCR